MDMNNILLSVRLMTYNHEEFIAQAIESCLAQKTEFDFEIIIGDDFSTDETLSICLEYEQRHPNIIKVLRREKYGDYYSRREKNGRLENFVDILQNCSGKYIAVLDGDDYWTDPYKLQKQVDFLDSNPDTVLTFHKVKILENGVLNDRDILEERYENIKDKYNITVSDLFEHKSFIHSCSVVYRNVKFELPHEFYHSPVGDFFLFIILAQYGKISRIDEFMGVYRRGVGVHSTLSDVNLQRIKVHYHLCILSYLSNEQQRKHFLQESMNALKEFELIVSEDSKKNAFLLENSAKNISFLQLPILLLLKIRNRINLKIKQ
jgi:glycosyltransferase involved in cell wall biosynthesis